MPCAPRHAALLSRYAENLFWLARYMERMENLARILDVTDTFVRHGADQSGWESVVRINADDEAFFKKHRAANGRDGARFLPDRPREPELHRLQHASPRARTRAPSAR